MKSTVHFYISKNEEGYTASGVDLGVVTEADSLDELMLNIQEAVQLYFEGEDVSLLGFSRTPSVLVNYELPEVACA